MVIALVAAAVLVALAVTIYLATRGVEGGVCAPTCFVKTDAGTSICDTDCNHDAQVTVQQCADAGLGQVGFGMFPTDLSQYRYALPIPNKYGRPHKDKVFAPIYIHEQLDIDDPDPDVVTAIVWAHGLAGNADGYFCSGYTAAKDAGTTGVLSIAPWFPSVNITMADWTGDPDAKGHAAHWEGTGNDNWIVGGTSEGGYTTAFDVLDAIVNALADAKSRGRFPNLRRVTLAGFSAGAQLLNRWSFFAPRTFALPVRLLISNGGSYLYLDEKRPALSCSAMHDTGKDHTCDDFVTPGHDSLPKTCEDHYDNYKFGLGSLDDLNSLYIKPFAANKSLVDAAKKAFFEKDIRYIFGTQDVCNCNVEGYDNSKEFCYPAHTACTPDAFGGTHGGHNCCDTYPDTGSDNVLVHSCPANLQGNSRLQRGLNYAYYLKHVSGTRPPVGFFEGGHNNSAFYNNPTFRQWAY